MPGPGSVACPKPVKVEKPKRWRSIRVKAKPKAERSRNADVRVYIFARERNVCRCCRVRPAESMHEIVNRSQGGKVSRLNSIAVCGQLGNGPECHGLCQRKEVRVLVSLNGAEGTISFWPQTPKASDWMRIKVGDCLLSPPMVETEAD